MAYAAKQGSRVNCLAQIGFVDFGKRVQIMSELKQGALPPVDSQ